MATGLVLNISFYRRCEAGRAKVAQMNPRIVINYVISQLRFVSTAAPSRRWTFAARGVMTARSTGGQGVCLQKAGPIPLLQGRAVRCLRIPLKSSLCVLLTGTIEASGFVDTDGFAICRMHATTC